jgi:hypothetical protein
VDALCNSLEPLLTVKHPNGLQPRVSISAETPERLEEILSGLKKMRRPLIEAGMQVCVTLGKSPIYLRYPLILDAYFDLPKKDWQALILARHNGGGRG